MGNFHSFDNLFHRFNRGWGVSSKAGAYAIGVLMMSNLAVAAPVFPDIHQNPKFKDLLETSISLKKHSFHYTWEDQRSFEYVIDYDDAFQFEYRNHQDEMKQFLETKTSIEVENLENTFHFAQNYHFEIQLPLPKEGSSESGDASPAHHWVRDEQTGHWTISESDSAPTSQNQPVRNSPKTVFTISLTAYENFAEDGNEESDVEYLDQNGKMKIYYQARILNLARQYDEMNVQLTKQELSDLDQFIFQARHFPQEMQLFLMLRGELQGEEDYEGYVRAREVERNLKFEIFMARPFYNAQKVAFIEERTHLPETVIIRLLRERHLD